jgi:hypothetical protein
MTNKIPFSSVQLIEQWRREGGGGQGGAIAPGRQREGAPKEGGKNFLFIYLFIY